MSKHSAFGRDTAGSREAARRHHRRWGPAASYVFRPDGTVSAGPAHPGAPYADALVADFDRTVLLVERERAHAR